MIDTTRDSAVPSVCLITMGCAKNEVDSAAMARRLREAGFSVTEEASSSDAIIVNTCSFIQAATEESIDAIFEAASLPKVDEGSAVLIVAGCMPARYGDDLAAELTEASAFVPCSRADEIADVVARAGRISLPVAAVGGAPPPLPPAGPASPSASGRGRSCSSREPRRTASASVAPNARRLKWTASPTCPAARSARSFPAPLRIPCFTKWKASRP